MRIIYGLFENVYIFEVRTQVTRLYIYMNTKLKLQPTISAQKSSRLSTGICECVGEGGELVYLRHAEQCRASDIRMTTVPSIFIFLIMSPDLNVNFVFISEA